MDASDTNRLIITVYILSCLRCALRTCACQVLLIVYFKNHKLCLCYSIVYLHAMCFYPMFVRVQCVQISRVLVECVSKGGAIMREGGGAVSSYVQHSRED